GAFFAVAGVGSVAALAAVGLFGIHELALSAVLVPGVAAGFFIAPLFGRLLTDMALNGASDYDLSGFRLEREALTEPGYLANWLV
ncbi:MAG: hypothetical protein EBU54_16570, partial [Mycobacteriaceae bacterium]|nr:hypothetical protein [Mycobacteriaceae bacterium]